MDLTTLSSICIFGDSIAYAHTDPMSAGWPGRLKRAATEVNPTSAVYVLSIPGDKLRDVAVRFEVEAKARRPDLVMIAVGTGDSPSDVATTTPIAAFEQQYRALIGMARTFTPRVMVVTPVNIDEGRETFGFANTTLQPYVETIRALAREEGVACVDLFGILSTADFDDDGLHPNPAGHEKIFERVRAAIDVM